MRRQHMSATVRSAGCPAPVDLPIRPRPEETGFVGTEAGTAANVTALPSGARRLSSRTNSARRSTVLSESASDSLDHYEVLPVRLYGVGNAGDIQVRSLKHRSGAAARNFGWVWTATDIHFSPSRCRTRCTHQATTSLLRRQRWRLPLSAGVGEGPDVDSYWPDSSEL